jgi:GTPase SAR1 family protein
MGETAGEPVHMVDAHSNFCKANVDRMINSSAELSAGRAPYAVVSIIGAQSSGKSYLMNQLFGTKFPVMDATCGWSQTSRGIMMSRCIRPSLVLLDVEGFDGKEKGEDTLFENQSALFALAVSDLMMVNMKTHDIGRQQGSGANLFRIIFQERTKLQGAGFTKILVVLRDNIEKTPLETLRRQILESMQQIWKDVNKSVKFNDYIEVNVIALSSKTSPEFTTEVNKLRQLLSNNRSSKVPASGFSLSSSIFWDTIKKKKELDIPSHQVALAGLYCRRLVEDIINSLNSQEKYKLLKAKQSPAGFRESPKKLPEENKDGRGAGRERGGQEGLDLGVGGVLKKKKKKKYHINVTKQKKN